MSEDSLDSVFVRINGQLVGESTGFTCECDNSSIALRLDLVQTLGGNALVDAWNKSVRGESFESELQFASSGKRMKFQSRIKSMCLDGPVGAGTRGTVTIVGEPGLFK